MYKAIFAPVTFPRSLDQLVNRPRLAPVDQLREFIWTGSVLNLFIEPLKEFVKKKSIFEEAFVSGRYDEASSHLDEIERLHGFSIWLIENRLHLLQEKSGLKSQKDYLEKVLATGITSLNAWVIYFLSIRCEENVSFANFESELSEVTAANELGDYVHNHIFAYDISKVKNPAAPVSWNEPNSIIDRFETFVSMLQLFICRSRKVEHSEIATALISLLEIGDYRLCNLLSVINSDPPKFASIVSFADAYTRGEYEAVDSETTESLELIARARAHQEETIDISKAAGLRMKVILLMQNVLELSPTSAQSKLQLKKIALSWPKHSHSFEIASFLERDHDNVLISEFTELECIAALNGPLENPWHASIISSFLKKVDWLDQMGKLFPHSEAISLRIALSGSSSDSNMQRLEKTIPGHRFSMYAGHIAYHKGDIQAAIENYLSAAKHPSEFISSHASRYLYEAYYAVERYKDCLTLAVNHILRNETAVYAYPIEALAKVCLEIPAFHSDISFAILVHLNVVHVHHRWERELSDAFENVLFAAGVDTPTEFIERSDECDLIQLTYFLRYICTPRILDDSTHFEGVEQIEEERIAVCQHLLKIDPNRQADYLAEIRSITRDSNIAQLLQKVQASKIYVDEEGIRLAVEPALKDAFLRYLQLLDSPDLAYQAEKLSKILGVMLTAAKASTEFKDLKLPASERQALFLSMLGEFVNEFAFNPAYGLDTHVSTSIRHGAFEGHLRTPLAIEDLLCKRKEKDYVLPANWESRLANLTCSEIEEIRRHLGRFTSKIEEAIAKYVKEKLHVQVGSNNGMFSFEAPREVNNVLLEAISKSTTYLELIDKFFAHCWMLVDDSMEKIRESLQSELMHQVNQACDVLIDGVEKLCPHENITPFVDAVVRAQTGFQVAVNDVADWFHRPQDLSRDPFDFEMAVQVALQQIENCYVKTPLRPHLELNVHSKMEGKMLDGICEIFFILLQNIILHSGFAEESIAVDLRLDERNNSVEISCTNQLAESVDLATRQIMAEEAISKYRRDTALRLARQEGGSGLSKVWRISEFDLRVCHAIRLTVHDDRKFTTVVTLTGLRTVNADIHS